MPGRECSRTLSVCTFIFHSIFISSFSSTDSTLWSYHFSPTSNSSFIPSFQCKMAATLSCLQVLYSFWDSILHSDTMRTAVSSRSPHDLHASPMLSLSTYFLTALVLKAWSWVANKSHPVLSSHRLSSTIQIFSHLDLFLCFERIYYVIFSVWNYFSSSLKPSPFASPFQHLKFPHSLLQSKAGLAHPVCILLQFPIIILSINS